MNAPLNSVAQAKPVPMQVLVKGKIDASRRHDGKTYTRLLTPAADAYSRPQVLEIRSSGKLGDRDEEVTVTCTLGGFTRKPFRFVDKDTGETTMVTPVDMTLDAVQ